MNTHPCVYKQQHTHTGAACAHTPAAAALQDHISPSPRPDRHTASRPPALFTPSNLCVPLIVLEKPSSSPPAHSSPSSESPSATRPPSPLPSSSHVLSFPLALVTSVSAGLSGMFFHRLHFCLSLNMCLPSPLSPHPCHQWHQDYVYLNNPGSVFQPTHTHTHI